MSTTRTLKKIKILRRELLTDYILSTALVSTYGIVFAFTLNLNNITEVNIPSMTFGTVMICTLIGIAIYYGLRKDKFSESNELFKAIRLSTLHPLFMFVDRLVFSVIAGISGEQPYCLYLQLGWTVLYTIFVAVVRPYNKRYH